MLRKFISLLFNFSDRLLLHARRWLFRNWFILRETVRCRQLEIGPGNCFDVPVRGEGLGSLTIGSQNTFGYRMAPRLGTGEILIQSRRPSAELKIGNRNVFSNNVSIIATQCITLGDDCLIGDRVFISDSDFHSIHPALRKSDAGPSMPVCIGNNVWFGSGVMVLKGVTIGDNAIVGALSLVNKSIPSNCIAAGNPARVIRAIE